MPITFNCPCGKALRVADEHAGRRVKCPACQAVGTVPAPEPDFEVVEDEPTERLAAPPPKARPVAKTAARDDDDDDERPKAKKKPDFRKGSRRRDDDDDDDEDDEEEERPRKKKKRRRPPPESSDDTANGSIGVGLLMMVGAVVWFVVGIAALDRIFIYPPILFVLGLVAFFKGLAGRG